jgi:hypothetical protein
LKNELILCLTIFLVSCAPINQSVIELTTIPAETAIQIKDKETIQPTIQQTPTITITVPQKPTKKPLPIETPVEVVTPMTVDTPIADVESTVPPIPDSLSECNEVNFSPDQKWATGFCHGDETRIVGLESEKEWSISYPEYYGEKADSGIGVIDPVFWSKDGNYLYFSIVREASGPMYFIDGSALIRMDLATGQISEVLKPTYAQFYSKYYSFSFSPDGRYLAYIIQPEKPLKVYLSDMETGHYKSFPLKEKYNQAGQIIWSPDQKKISLGLGIVDYEGNIEDQFSICVIDFENESIRELFEDSTQKWYPKAWKTDNLIELSDGTEIMQVFDLSKDSLVEE